MKKKIGVLILAVLILSSFSVFANSFEGGKVGLFNKNFQSLVNVQIKLIDIGVTDATLRIGNRDYSIPKQVGYTLETDDISVKVKSFGANFLNLYFDYIKENRVSEEQLYEQNAFSALSDGSSRIRIYDEFGTANVVFSLAKGNKLKFIETPITLENIELDNGWKIRLNGNFLKLGKTAPIYEGLNIYLDGVSVAKINEPDRAYFHNINSQSAIKFEKNDYVTIVLKGANIIRIRDAAYFNVLDYGVSRKVMCRLLEDSSSRGCSRYWEDTEGNSQGRKIIYFPEYPMGWTNMRDSSYQGDGLTRFIAFFGEYSEESTELTNEDKGLMHPGPSDTLIGASFTSGNEDKGLTHLEPSNIPVGASLTSGLGSGSISSSLSEILRNQCTIVDANVVKMQNRGDNICGKLGYSCIFAMAAPLDYTTDGPAMLMPCDTYIKPGVSGWYLTAFCCPLKSAEATAGKGLLKSKSAKATAGKGLLKPITTGNGKTKVEKESNIPTKRVTAERKSQTTVRKENLNQVEAKDLGFFKKIFRFTGRFFNF
ncbi:MAG: hypothetical protein U9Q69_05830 [Nanoarchaeota archaeon]|nr:hypothetical protein [Nanoarchaeota archaeon]